MHSLLQRHPRIYDLFAYQKAASHAQSALDKIQTDAGHALDIRCSFIDYILYVEHITKYISHNDALRFLISKTLIVRRLYVAG